MTDYIRQTEADALIAVEKHYRGEETYNFPSLGGSLRLPLFSKNSEEFSLDITRGKIEVTKNTFQGRARKVIILVRLDIDQFARHRNPDDEWIVGHHIHLYKEGYHDRWAYPIPPVFTNINDISQTLDEFMNYINIVTKPKILRELFV